MSGKRHCVTCCVIIAWLAVSLSQAERSVTDDEAERILSRSKRSTSCHPKFQSIDGHSACLPGEDASVVTEAEKQIIVNTHNAKRAGVDPTATNMMKLIWDDEVAMVAQKWSSLCTVGHEADRKQRSIPGRFYTGQNVAKGQADWASAINAWYNEVSDFTYGDQTMMDNFMNIGHYTQVVWAKSTLVGCGSSVCDDGQTIYVCNYAPPGNLNTMIHTPYISGVSCAACSGHCNDGTLCDCGMACNNGGTLKLDTCTCTCALVHDQFQAPDCRLNCSFPDKAITCADATCPTKENKCPVTCGVCPAAGVDYKGSGVSPTGQCLHLLLCLALSLLHLLPPLTA